MVARSYYVLICRPAGDDSGEGEKSEDAGEGKDPPILFGK
jgi:hypothetical protein